MMDTDEVRKEVGATMIHLAITGYSEDKEQRDRVERMATAISYAISMIEELEDLKAKLEAMGVET